MEKRGFRTSPAIGCFFMSGFAIFGGAIATIFLIKFGFYEVFDGSYNTFS